MPVNFTRLRITGFKSFAEPVSVEILPGLTGIVGPNGCGKSNVVEALRWAMGESSARSLRGGEMDDLIFAGTTARPARNLAEVVLTLEDAAGLAPPPHDGAELQISRRIERGAGSAYRVNGRETRARDVQTLFADLASGARSSAMVSQGRVAAIVNARPEERRSVLEEAAGITGLHARRHEAELKLRATEANLARAEDLRVQLGLRAQSLSEQAKQAARYREVAAELRDSEATLLALLHARARRAVASAGAARLAEQAALAEAQQLLSEAEIRETDAARDLPSLREAEAVGRTLLERRRIEAENAARAGERATQDAELAEIRLRQAQQDHDDAAARLTDAQAAQDRMVTEQNALEIAAAALPQQRAAQASQLAMLRARLHAAEQAADAATSAAAAASTRHAEHARDQEAATNRLERADTTLLQIATERAQRQAVLPDPTLVQAHEAACHEAAEAVTQAEQALERAAAGRADATRAADAAQSDAAEGRRRHAAALQAMQQAQTRAARLQTERATLETRLHQARAGLVPEADRAAALAAVGDAEAVLAHATTALDAVETARGRAVSQRLEAAAWMQDANRHRQQLDAARSQADAARRRAAAQHDALARDHEEATRALVPPEELATAMQARAAAETGLSTAHTMLVDADTALDAAAEAAGNAATYLALTREAHGRLAAEVEGLARALVDDDGPSGASRNLSDALDVPEGLEIAFAACLSEALDAAHPDDASDAPRAWHALASLEPSALPGDAVPLHALVTAPDTLARALSHAGLISDDAGGDILQALLRPGQCLVSRGGALWRWDGYRVAAGVPNAAALHLQQRTRLREVRLRLDEAASILPAAQEKAAHLAILREAAAETAREARSTRAHAERLLARTREDEIQIVRRDAETRARRDALAPQCERAAAAYAEADAASAAAQAAWKALDDPSSLAAAHDRAKRDESEAVAAEIAARAARRRAEEAVQQARDEATSRLGRHAESRTAHDALTPLLARTQEEADAAAVALADSQTALVSFAPEARDAVLESCLRRLEAAERAEHDARDTRRAAQECLADRIETRDRTASALLEGRSRLDALDSQQDAAQTERHAAQAALHALQTAADHLPDPELAAQAAQAAAETVLGLRRQDREMAEQNAALASEEAALEARRGSLEAALNEWRSRRQTTELALATVTDRLAAAQTEHALRAEGPAEAARQAHALQDALAAAKDAYEAAQATLNHAASSLQAAQLERRTREAGLTVAREAALRSDARHEQAEAILAQLLAETPHPPTTVPDDLSDAAETSLRRRVTRLARERDEMGPVNLRAETELHEADTQIALITQERDEIEHAIAQLRRQIGNLNREGRDRLMAVFEQVDRHFQSLFARMFNGGRAHLGMVGSDDPLSAGLEIYAQPPGKKLATLSLLSGGEQALTALSLVFAVLRCNPAPICVLDEVDAPLDDANVQRFCTLLDDMVREAGTRFLVVTHHQLTMAHMDRLYGVTMQERGVSRVLSVDMACATAMVD